ncbi:hypothetical protein VAR608DRAFT_0361 [Variovorax sp. HW608]|uniref:hypothetical protein n=1 Tax=Variovorax sp. HW608 TaxID=1034889 RepID=UPI00081F8465|nr:hypothetical protein [Variovorax sp. HW608]SCK09629.1 hypothetical protein VAR608DRAFT_0361 [Variovorax sp. HW608]
MTEEFVRLEMLNAPFGLDGSDGDYRYPPGHCDVDCVDDVGAARLWLSEHEESESTWRVYRRAAELLFNWAWFINRRAVSSMREEDFDLFLRALIDPPKDWLQRRGRSRLDGSRSPMNKPMGDAGLSVVVRVLKSLIGWMHRHGYAHLRFARSSNAFLSAEEYTRRVSRTPADPMRLAEWHHVCWVLDTHCALGTRAAIELIYFCQLRLAEVSNLLWGHLREPREGFPAWELLIADSRPPRRLLVAEPAGLTLKKLRAEAECLFPVSPQRRLFKPREETLRGHIERVFVRAALRANDLGDVESAQALGGRRVRSLRRACESHVPLEWRERWSYCRDGVASTAAVQPGGQDPEEGAFLRHPWAANHPLNELWDRLRPGWEHAAGEQSPDRR